MSVLTLNYKLRLYTTFKKPTGTLQLISTEINNAVQDRCLSGIVLGMPAVASWLVDQSKAMNYKGAHFSHFS